MLVVSQKCPAQFHIRFSLSLSKQLTISSRLKTILLSNFAFLLIVSVILIVIVYNISAGSLCLQLTAHFHNSSMNSIGYIVHIVFIKAAHINPAGFQQINVKFINKNTNLLFVKSSI